MRQVSFPTLLASLVAGVLAIAGFAPLGFWPLPVVSLAVLFALLARIASMRGGFRIGLAWGVGFFIDGAQFQMALVRTRLSQSGPDFRQSSGRQEHSASTAGLWLGER